MDRQTTTSTTTESDEDYASLEQILAQRVKAHEAPLFQTSALPDALWGHYLMNLREERRKHYDCHSCRKFVQNYGGLVSVEANGVLRPLLWSPEGIPEFFRASFVMLHDLVARSKIDGVFLTDGRAWGDPVTPDKKTARIWTHLHGRISVKAPYVARSAVLNASQVMAEKREDFKMLVAALRDYAKDVTAEALRVLKSDALARSEKALGVAEWFHALHGKETSELWLAVATAPAGFPHVRSTIISTLLDDVKAGLPFESVARRWGEKMHPLQYQRPQAAPAPGAIDQAEKLVEKLGVQRSLERRYATLDDVQEKVWTPRAPEEPVREGGVFGHLRSATKVSPLILPPQRSTWANFAKALAEAREVDVLLPHRGAFYGLVTAKHADAPTILQWDEAERRNPVSWYFYNGGSRPSDWGLAGEWGRVTSVFFSPPHWHGTDLHKHQKKFVAFAIEGAKDQRNDSLCLFPETLKSEFHGIRSVVEAHSRVGKISGEGSANGLAFDETNEVTVRLDRTTTFVLDRWN